MTGLEHVSSSTLGVFLQWIGWIGREPAESRYRLEILSNLDLLWQRASLTPLELVAPGSVVILPEGES